ncbi:hypothetical protein N656DRAFT_22931 [Canariomyces notabilis]|uniref:Uncharacterized protein n=1 Tax=Canariomyces notabilis TaxID=2074819 RepID=A0AAN6YXJ4_9PEZI|nr:hypothetical protein N656DRAFT_22931 [Canariomyces arenarius]
MAAEKAVQPPLLPLSAPPRPPDHDSLAAPPPPVLIAPAPAAGPGAPPATAPQQQPPVPVPPPPFQPHYDPSLDPAIKHLLDQQAELQAKHAEVQAKLAALLPQKYGPNIKVELEMLRHKHRVLRAYADDNREPSCFLLSHVTPDDRSFHPIFAPLSPQPYLMPPIRIVRQYSTLVRRRRGESVAVSVRVHRDGLC